MSDFSQEDLQKARDELKEFMVKLSKLLKRFGTQPNLILPDEVFNETEIIDLNEQIKSAVQRITDR